MNAASDEGNSQGAVASRPCRSKEKSIPLRILLVEDNPADVFFFREILRGRLPCDYEIFHVESIGEAKTLLAKQAVDVILLDLTLPDSEGLDSINKIAAVAEHLPIVVLTGVTDIQIVPEAVRRGAQDYLLKGKSDGETITRSIQYAIDRKRIEEQLRKKQRELEENLQQLHETKRRLELYRDRYIDLYDFAPLAYITLDDEGYVQEINLAGARLLAADRDLITGYDFGEFLLKEDLPKLKDLLRKCVEERHEATAEFRLITKDSRVIFAQLHSVPVENAEEGTVFCKTAVTDITERRRMEETIRQSRDFLQTVIDALPDSIMVIDREYRIILANRAAREFSGNAEIVSQRAPCHLASHRHETPCDDTCHPCPLHEIIRTKAPLTLMHKHYDAQGKELFVEITAAPVFDASGEVTHVIEACRDITDRKRDEEEIVQSRNLLRTLIDHLSDCIYIKDRQGRFLIANAATARLMAAATPDDLAGKSDGDFYPQEYAAKYRADEEALFQSGLPLVNQAELHPDARGVPRSLFTTKIPLTDSHGQIVGLVGISRETTGNPTDLPK